MKAVFDTLPETLPIFPLAGVVLLPGVSLPLNIFEPRYLAMIDHALKTDRLIGMIQPRPGDAASPYKTGCAGRITSFEETDDGRYLIVLKGLCRFTYAAEALTSPRGFRMAAVCWKDFQHDLQKEDMPDVCRDTLLDVLRPYLTKVNMNCDQWDNMRNVSCDKLVSTLTMICPFTAEEKQMLLEARDITARMKVLCAFLENALGEDIPGCH